MTEHEGTARTFLALSQTSHTKLNVLHQNLFFCSYLIFFPSFLKKNIWKTNDWKLQWHPTTTKPNAPARSLIRTDAGADLWRARAVVTLRTGRETRPPLPHPVQLQVEEKSWFTRQTAVQGRACCTACLTVAAHWRTTCSKEGTHFQTCICTNICFYASRTTRSCLYHANVGFTNRDLSFKTRCARG